MNHADIVAVPTAKAPKYGGPAETQSIRKEVVQDLVTVQSGLMLKRLTERVPLSDPGRLTEAVEQYVSVCKEHGLIPSIQGLAAVCGCSRVFLYRYLNEHPDSPSGIILERCRAGFMAIRQAAVDRGCAAETQGIFLAKNSGQGYEESYVLTPVPRNDPLADLDIEGARARLFGNDPAYREREEKRRAQLIESIPVEDDGDAEGWNDESED